MTANRKKPFTLLLPPVTLLSCSAYPLPLITYVLGPRGIVGNNITRLLHWPCVLPPPPPPTISIVQSVSLWLPATRLRLSLFYWNYTDSNFDCIFIDLQNFVFNFCHTFHQDVRYIFFYFFYKQFTYQISELPSRVVFGNGFCLNSAPGRSFSNFPRSFPK